MSNHIMGNILGIDQGSSHTRAAVCRQDGTIAGLGKSIGACHSVHGMQPAMRAIQEAAQAALHPAGLRPDEVGLVFGGLTGADWQDEYALLEENLRTLQLGGQVHVVNDSIIALRGGTQAPYGAIVIAGSGANCAVRSPDQREFIYHYYLEDDLQGGQALGRNDHPRRIRHLRHAAACPLQHFAQQRIRRCAHHSQWFRVSCAGGHRHGCA
jgi:N-acetylglucosamine kinase-like BadF-type ATPase